MFRLSFALSLGIGLALALALPAAGAREHEHGSAHEHGHEHEHAAAATADEGAAKVRVAPQQVVVQVNGVVCSFCAQGLSRALRKIPGLDASQYKKGVRVEIEEQRVLLAFAPGARFPLADIQERIRKGGYEARSYHVLLEGQLARAQAGQPVRAFEAANGLHFALAAADARAFALSDEAARVALQLTVAPEALAAKQPQRARIERVQPTSVRDHE